MVRNAVDEVAIQQGCYWDEAAAERVIRFFDHLRLTIEPFAGQPFVLQPWQIEIINQAFGWKRPDGTRRFREIYVEIPKKNGKSGFASGLALEGLTEEIGARVFVGARTQGQAMEVFEEAVRMVKENPEMSAHLTCRVSPFAILFAERNASIKVLTADSGGQDGKNASRVILDELHRLPNRGLYDVVKYSGKARKQPMLWEFTTAGDSKTSICYEIHERAKKILSGADVSNIRFLPVIFAADEADDLDAEATWQKANPALKVILNVDDFREDHREAKEAGGLAWVNFKRLSLGIWSERANMWIEIALWDRCEAEFDSSFFRGRRTLATIDLSSQDDLSAVTLTTVVRAATLEDGPDVVVQLTRYFVPQENVRRRSERDGVPYQEWIDAGWITATPGYAVDPVAMLNQLVAWRDDGIEIQTVGADPWNLLALESSIPQNGFELVKISQTMGSLTTGCKAFQRLILTREYRHEGNPVTRWCVGNASVVSDANGNIKYDKTDTKKRIDGVATSCMGVGLAMRDEPPPTPIVTVYG